jgi:Alkylmercury lyase
MVATGAETMSGPEQVMVGTTLAAAGISPGRCGRKRTHGLSDPERALYHWVLSRFAERGRPSGAELRARSLELGLEPTLATAAFAREDLVDLDSAGEIAVAYPFSGRPTRHQVELAAGHEVDAMCAIDALGMAAMLAQPVKVRSSDPTTGEQIIVQVEPDGDAEWRPDEAVVLAGSLCDGPNYQGCCGVLNFFSSRASAEDYLTKHEDVQGRLISIPDAIAAGTAVFGEALKAKPS